ncbi:MAG: fatty acid desaturase [Fimbriimonas sp.]|nr:fatty acid desaturase [Fimbriimonas sp.]
MATVTRDPSSQIPNYRNQVKKALPAKILEPDYSNLGWFVVHGAIIAAAYFVLKAHFSWWSAPLISLVVGHTFACMGFLAHDICHGGTVKKLWIRDLLAGLGFSPLAIGPYLWRRWHNADHHNNTQVEGVDPDHLFTIEDYKNNPILRWLYRISPLARNLIIFSSFSYRMDQQMIRMVITYLRSSKTTSGQRVLLVAQFLVPLTLWVSGSLYLGTQVFWWGYFVPLLIGNAVAISYIATNHFLNPLADDRDVLATSLSVTLPKPLRWLDPWHQHFGAHVAHHLFPAAPGKYARQIEAKVAELWPDRFHTMPITTALKLLWKTPWVYEDKTVLVDPHREIRSGTLGHGLDHSKKKASRKGS